MRTFVRTTKAAAFIVTAVVSTSSLSWSKPLSMALPQGREFWSAGSRHFLKWDAAQFPPASMVQLDYTADAGKTWRSITRTANKGSYLWTVPHERSRKCRVRVSGNQPVTTIMSRETFSIIPTQKVSEYEWTKVTDEAAFAPRDGAGALTFRDRMWLLGGWNPGDKKNFPRVTSNDVWSSKDGLTWNLEKPNTFLDHTFDAAADWEGRHTAGYVIFKDKMWIVGGDANQGHYQSDVWNSKNGKDWTHVNKGVPVPWGPRALHYTVAFNGKIWVMGGQTVPAIAAAEERFYRDIWNSEDGIHWKQVTPREPFWPQRGMIGGTAVFRGRMWILGGGTYDTPQVPVRKFYNDVWSSADGVDWTRHVESAPWKSRQYHDVAVFDNHLWVMEGYSYGNRNDVWYSADGVDWHELPGTPWGTRHAASVFVHDGALWMVTGNNMQSDVWKLRRSMSAKKNTR